MHKFIQQFSLAIAAIVAFIPFHIVAPWLAIPAESTMHIALFIVQLFTCVFLYFCYKQNTSRSFRLFWQYLFIAVVTVIASRFISGSPGSVSLQLYQDFASLFIYFFILLAIETNPHLSDVPLNKYSSGRVPAVFFTLICFCYFILLPAEFSEQTYLSGKFSLLFHLLINSLIVFRLLRCLLNAKVRFWRNIFALLLASAFFLLLESITGFVNHDSTIISVGAYYHQLTIFVPYFLLTLAANVTLLSLIHI